MNGFLDLLLGKKSDSGLAGRISEAVKDAKDLRKWEVNYVTLEMMIKEEREEARKEGIETTVFELVSCGELLPASGAKRLNITVEQLKEKMESKGYDTSGF